MANQSSPSAGLIIIGDEILKGRVQDSNSPFLTGRLWGAGVRTHRILTLPDRVPDIAESVRAFSKEFDHVITTGLFRKQQQTDKQTDKQQDTQTADRHTNRHTDIQTDIHTDRHTNRHTNRQTDSQTDRQTVRQTDKQTNNNNNTTMLLRRSGAYSR